MKFIIILNIFIISCWSSPTDILENKKWIEFKQTYNKEYHSIKEELKRFNIFEDNLNRIKKHNKRYKAGMTTFKMGLNQFGDLTSAEFVKYATGFTNDTIKKLSSENQNYLKMPLGEPLRDSVDWRTEGIVSDVKNQFQCSACYAFSAAGSLEGQFARKNGRLVPLSVQNLVDCSMPYGNYGCRGGRVDAAFAFVKDYGIETEQFYPYAAALTDCILNPFASETKIKKHMYLQQGNENILRYAIDVVGPISVSIDMPPNMQFYKEGIYYNPECSSILLKHGVLVVGYGQIDGTNYYIIKNSWGTTWGEQGYLKLLRNNLNHCGIATNALYPIV